MYEGGNYLIEGSRVTYVRDNNNIKGANESTLFQLNSSLIQNSIDHARKQSTYLLVRYRYIPRDKT